MHPALGMPDILLSIFQHTNPEADSVCTQVCRLWFDHVLDILWYHVPGLDRLFRLLSPLYEVGPVLTFREYHIPADRWQRFSFYADRVRRIEFTDQSVAIHRQSFMTLAISRPTLNLFPNLRHLTWSKDPGYARWSLALTSLFIHPGLRSLSVTTGVDATQDELSAIDNFFSNVLLRAPSLQHLEFLTEIPFRSIGPSLANFLRGLPQVKTVRLSAFLLSSDIVTALGQCPRLEAIRVPNHRYNPLEEDDLENFFPVAERGSFPCIKEIALECHIWNASRFLTSGFPASRLTALELRTLQLESPENIGFLIHGIGTACHSLMSFYLVVNHRQTDEEFEPLPFSCLEPLLACGSLTQLCIYTPSPLLVDDVHALQMALAWPKMRELVLNPYPFPHLSSPQDNLSLFAVTTFAEYCPDIRVLKLYVHLSTIPTTERCKTFKQLEQLTFGLGSDDFEPEELALFLTDMTPPTCEVKRAEIQSAMIPSDMGMHQLLIDRRTRFEQARTMLPTLRKIHSRYQSRLQVLGDEVKKLSGPHPR